MAGPGGMSLDEVRQALSDLEAEGIGGSAAQPPRHPQQPGPQAPATAPAAILLAAQPANPQQVPSGAAGASGRATGKMARVLQKNAVVDIPGLAPMFSSPCTVTVQSPDPVEGPFSVSSDSCAAVKAFGKWGIPRVAFWNDSWSAEGNLGYWKQKRMTYEMVRRRIRMKW